MTFSKPATAIVLATLALSAGCNQSNNGDTAAPAAQSSEPETVAAATKPATPFAGIPLAELSDPVVVMKTSLGDLHLRLYQSRAPRTVANFIDYVNTRYYDGTIFHQVDAGYVAIGGGYDDKLKPRTARYPIPNEATNGLKNKRGTIAMARDPANPNSARAQFFINLSDNPKLDHRGPQPEEFGFCVFGEVVDGFDVLDKIAQAKTGPVAGFEKMPLQTVTLGSVIVAR